MGPGHLDVVAGDPGEARVAGVAQLHDPFQGGRSPVELFQRRDRVGLIEVEDVGVEQAPCRVELVGHAIGIGP